MSGARPIVGADRSVIQQSLTVDPADYKYLAVDRLMLAVILTVTPIDSDDNRSAMQTLARKGHSHECTVLVVNDGTSPYLTLENVLITPDSPSGLDDFEERLPRGTSSLVTGEEYNSAMHGIDPFDLDGDWCVVAFLGGKLDSPFVLRWWPHSRNTFDPASSGKGLEGDLLVQNRRYFRRTNGVESVITSKGDIIISTTFANSILTPSEDPALGRIARTIDEEEGGSIRINIKPSQTFELTFNPQDDGVGIVDANDPEIPQTNPPAQEPAASEDRPETYIYADRDQLDLSVTTSVTITTQDVIQLRSQLIELGEDAVEGIPRDDRLQAQLAEIKTMLDDIKTTFNAHKHLGGSGAAVEGISPSAGVTESYSVGDTATDLVTGV